MALLATSAILLGGCSGEPSAEFITLPGDHVFAMIVSAGTPADDLPGLAKEKCGATDFCKVLGWNDRAKAARSMPMTDSEVASQVFHYTLNRNTSFEQLLWNCTSYPEKKGNPSQCMATPEPEAAQ